MKQEKIKTKQQTAQKPAQVLNLSPKRKKPLESQKDLCQREGQNETQDKWEAFPTSEEYHPDLLYHELRRICKR